MLERHGKAFTFSPGEIGCVDLTIVEPMVIFTVPHVPWRLKTIQVPRAHMLMLMEVLKQKVELGILASLSAPYSNRWFTVPKKNGTLRFIQDLQPVNKVTIRNAGVGPSMMSSRKPTLEDPYTRYETFTRGTASSIWPWKVGISLRCELLLVWSGCAPCRREEPTQLHTW